MHSAGFVCVCGLCYIYYNNTVPVQFLLVVRRVDEQYTRDTRSSVFCGLTVWSKMHRVYKTYVVCLQNGCRGDSAAASSGDDNTTRARMRDGDGTPVGFVVCAHVNISAVC